MSRYVFRKEGDVVIYGRSGCSDEAKVTTFDALPIKIKEKLAILMLYPETYNTNGAVGEDTRSGNMYWGDVDEEG